MKGETLSRRELTHYGMLALPVAFAGFPLYILAPDFYATRYDVPLATLGVLLLGLRLFDAVQDPLIGVFSDRYQTYKRLFIPVSALLLCLSLYALFNHLPFAAPLWFTLCIGGAVTAYSILTINLAALGARRTGDPQEQTRLNAFREGCGLIGLLLGVSLPGLLPEEDAYLVYSLILAALMAWALGMFMRWMREQPLPPAPSEARVPPLRALRSVDRNFLAVYALSMLASSLPAVLVIFFIRDQLGAEALTGLFLLLYFLSGAVTMPLWKWSSRQYGARTTWCASMALASVTFVWAFLLGNGDVLAYGIVCLLSGAALGADLSLPPVLLATDLHRHSLQAHAAVSYSLLALISKGALALASAIALPLLDLGGFIPATDNSTGALLVLSILYALVPSILKLAAAALLFRSILHPSPEALHETSFSDHPDPRSHHHV